MTEERKRQLRWEGVLCLFLALVLIFGLRSAVRVQAAKPGTAQQKATTGTLGENGGITWSYDEGTKTLTVSGEDELKGNYNYSPFTSICAEKEVERIVFENCKLTGSAEYLFYGLNKVKEIDLSGLDTGNVQRMYRMFDGCSGLTSLDVSGLDTGNVTDMKWMFNRCSGLTSLDVSGFDTGNVTDMGWMFDGCSSLTSLDVSGLDTGNVTDMNWMFSGCSGLTSLDLSGLDTGNVTDVRGMFLDCSGLTSLDVSGFDTGNVTDMGAMFGDCSGLTSLDVSGFNTGNVMRMGGMFSGCSGLTSLDVSGFDTGNVTNMGAMFGSCSGLTSLDVSKFDTGNVTNMGAMFGSCSGLTSLDISGLNTGNVTDMMSLFEGCSSLTSLDVSGFDTKNVTRMDWMFSNCSGLTSLDVSGFDTKNVTWIYGMFQSCSGLTSLDVSGFDTKNVTRMDHMFSNCSGLTSLDVSKFDTGNVTDMNTMFMDCSGLTSLDVSGFDTGNVTNMGAMFGSCSGLTSLDVSGFDTCNVTSMNSMFRGCSGLTILDVSGFDTKNVTSMWGMFLDCSGLTSLDLSGFEIKNDTNVSWMLDEGCTPSVLKAPKTVGKQVQLCSIYRDAEGNVYSVLTAENAGKKLRRADLVFYEIHFDGNGSTGGSTALIDCEMGKSYTLPANGFTRTGYTFTGWNTKADGTGTAYADKATVKDLASEDGAVVTLYAQWKSNNYSIAFSGNGATEGTMSTLTNRQVGTSYTLPANKFKRAEYTFTGWNTKKDGTGTAYADKASVKDLATENGAVVTLYAQWKANSYSIAFKGNGSTEGEMNTVTNRKVGTSYTLPANKFKRTGYTFTGWNTKKDGTGTAYADKASVKDLATENGAVVTLYAQWKVNSYSIAFKGNGSTEGEMNTLTNRKVGTSYTLPTNKFKRTGYSFTGWNTKKDGTGTAYANKASVKDLTKTNGATVTLYAQWKKNAVTYKIKFNANGGTGKMSALKCKTGMSYKLPANAFKKQGYTFAGWNTKKDGKGKAYKNKASVKDLTKKSGEVVTLYAQWKPNTYTVKFDGNKATSGKMKDLKDCQYDKKFKLPKVTYKRKGYTFVGWNTKKNGTGKSYKNGAQVKNLTNKNKGTVVLYAQWIKKK